MLLEPAASLSGEDSSGMEDDNMDDAEGLENRQYNLVSERSPHTLEETYRLGEELGRGTFSVVRLATPWNASSLPVNCGDVRRAVKIIDKRCLTPRQLARVTSEISLLRDINHPHIIRLTDVFENHTKIYLVMELLAGGDLFEAIVARRRYSEEEARATVHNLASAVMYLHQRGIIHRDLKPENLLLPRDPRGNVLWCDVRIADFGFARLLRRADERLTTPCGTPAYVAPEIAMNVCYTHAVDMWSVGVILYILLCGFPPFHAHDENALLDQVATGRFSFPSMYWRDVSAAAKDLVRCLLVRNPYKRYNPQQVLSHPWITGTYAIPPPLPRDPLTGRGSLVAISRMSKKKRSGRAKKASRRSLHEDASSPQFKKGSSSSGTFNLRLAERSENAADSNRNQDEACLASSSSAESLVSPRRYIAKSSGTSSASSITSSGPSKGRARSRSIDATNNERERKGQVHPTSVVSPAKASDHPVRRHASSKASLSSASSVLYGQGASCPPLSPRYMMISAFRSSSLHTIGQCGNRSLSSSSTPVITSASVNTSSSPSAVHRSRRVRRTSSPPPCENRRDFSRSKTESSLWQRRRRYLQQRRLGVGAPTTNVPTLPVSHSIPAASPFSSSHSSSSIPAAPSPSSPSLNIPTSSSNNVTTLAMSPASTGDGLVIRRAWSRSRMHGEEACEELKEDLLPDHMVLVMKCSVSLDWGEMVDARKRQRVGGQTRSCSWSREKVRSVSSEKVSSKSNERIGTGSRRAKYYRSWSRDRVEGRPSPSAV